MRSYGRYRCRPIRARFWWLVFAEELFTVFGEADEDDDGRPRQTDEEHHFQNAHRKDRQMLHKKIVT